MASVATVRVYRPDITTPEGELSTRLQALAELELQRQRTRSQGQGQAAIAAALADGLARITAGTIDQHDLPLAAAAIQRDEALTITLITTPPPAPHTDN